MPRFTGDNADIKNKEYEKLVKFYQNNDVEGFYAHLEEIVPHNQASSDFVMEDPIGDVVSTFIGELAVNENNPPARSFLDNVISYGGKRQGEAIIQTGRKADEIEQQIANGEIEGLELAGADSKTCRKTAEAISYFKLSVNNSLTRVKIINRMLLDCAFEDKDGANLINPERRNDMAQVAATEARDYVYAQPELDQKTKERYLKAYNVQASSSVYVPTSKGKLSHKESMRFTSDKMDDYAPDVDFHLFETLRAQNDEELASTVNEFKQDRLLAEKFEAASDEWKNTASELLGELEASSDGKAKSSLQYKNLKFALENSSKIGGNYRYTTPDDSNLLSGTEYNAVAVKSLIDNAIQFGNEYSPNPEFGKKVNQAALKARQKINKAYEEGFGDLCKKNNSNVHSTTLNIGYDIKRAEIEQLRRAMYSDPEKAKEFRKLNSDLIAKDRLQDKISIYKQKAARSLAYTKSTAKYFEKDMASRGTLAPAKHKDYLALANISKELSSIDPGKIHPRELVQKLMDAKRCADKYIESHTGIKHLGSGWSFTEGGNRVRNARYFSEALGGQIESLLLAAADTKTFIKDGQTPDGSMEQLQNEKEVLRAQLHTKKLVFYPTQTKAVSDRLAGYEEDSQQYELKRKDPNNNAKLGTVMESGAKVAAESITELDKMSKMKGQLSAEQKEAAISHITRVVVYDREMIKKEHNMNENEYKQYINKLSQNPNFRNVIGDITKEKLAVFCNSPNLSKKIALDFTSSLYNESSLKKQYEKQANQMKDQIENNHNPALNNNKINKNY